MTDEPLFGWLAADSRLLEPNLREAFATWRTRYLEHQGEKIVGVLLKGTEAHLLVAPAWRQRMLPTRAVRRFAELLIDEAGGMLTTRVLHAASGPQEFVKRLGFTRTWSDEAFDYFALCAPPFKRTTP